MGNGEKTKEQLINELSELRQRISELEKSEKQLIKAQSEVKSLKQQMEFILGATKTGLDIIDSDFNIRYIDPEWQKAYGDPNGKKCYEYFMDRTEVCPNCGILKALETKTVTVTEEILVKEGNRPIQVTTIPFQNEKDEWLFAEVNVDITERKKVEETLNKREQEIRMIADNVPGLISYVDAYGCYRFVNKQYEKWFGVPRTEIIGKHYRQVLGDAAYELIKGYVEAALLGQRVSFEEAVPYIFSGTRWVVAEYVPDADDSGKVKGFFALVTDITKRKLAEESLRESEEKFRNLSEQSPHMIFINKKRRVVYANERCVEVMGHKKDELYSPDFDFFRLIAPESINTVKENYNRHVLGEEVEPYEYALITKDGKRIDAIMATKLINYEGEKTILGIVTDVTERKHAEDELRKIKERFDFLLTAAPMAVYTSKTSGNYGATFIGGSN